MNKLVSSLLFAGLMLGGCAHSHCQEDAMKAIQAKADASPMSQLGAVKFKVLDCAMLDGTDGYICSLKASDNEGNSSVMIGTIPAPEGCKVKSLK